MSAQVAPQSYSDSQAPAQYPVFNKQKKWKQLQEQAKQEKKESIELLSEKKNGNTSPVNKSGRKSPQTKFIFTQKTQAEKKKPVIQIKPILTMAELEQMNTHTNDHIHTHTHDTSNSRSPSVSPISSISISPEPVFENQVGDTNISPVPVTTISKSNVTAKRSQQRSSQNQRQSQSQSQSPTPIDIDINLDSSSSTIALHRPIPTHRPISQHQHQVQQQHQYLQQQHHYLQQKQQHYRLVPISPAPISPLEIFSHKYNLQKNIINTLKALVFQHSALICGAFNSQQCVINEYYKAFLNYIMSIELNNINNINNNIKFTSQQINNLFMDEFINPETKLRLDLQKSMEILTTGDKMYSFIDNVNKSFMNAMCAYKVEHNNRGNMKSIVDSTHELQNYSHNHNGNEIYLHIVKISIPEHYILFEVRFLILDNEKRKTNKNYVIPLTIPEGLYDAEHLHLTNNGNDVYSIQHSSSSIEFIVNNINMKIVSLMPKMKDYDYTKMAHYIKKIIPTTIESPYIYEFDIFNTIHKKGDFWLSNKNKEEPTPHSCEKCNVDISTNARYVIAKCCHKKYHIECMEMNYYPLIDTRFSHTYSYLVCDCGCSIIDENSCNSRLLLALYRNYY